MAFCDNLIYLRKNSSMTQEQLAEELEVSRQAVSKWETGEAFPETDKLMQLCNKFGVTMDELMRGDVTAKTDCGEPDDEEHVQDGKLHRLSASLSGLIIVIAAAIYVTLGGMFNMWHPLWVVFIYAIGLCALSDGACKCTKQSKKPLLDAINGSMAVFSVAAYLTMGLYAGLWHPGWVIFVCLLVFYMVMAIFDIKK